MKISNIYPNNQKYNSKVTFEGEKQLKWLTGRLGIAELNSAMQDAKSSGPEIIKQLFNKKHQNVRTQVINNGFHIKDKNAQGVNSFNFANRKDNEIIIFESTPNSITYRHEKPLSVFKDLTYLYNNGEIIRTLTTGINGTLAKPQIEKLVEGSNRFEKVI